MSETVELGLILRNTQKAANAAEAALEIAQRLENDLGLRFTALEGRVTNLVAGQNSLQRGMLRIADTLVDHGGKLDSIEKTLTDYTARLDNIDKALADILTRLPPAETA